MTATSPDLATKKQAGQTGREASSGRAGAPGQGRPTRLSASVWTGSATSAGCGWLRVARVRSFGSRCSPTRATVAAAARGAFEELVEQWGQRYPAIIRLWDNAWQTFTLFLDYDIEIRRVLSSRSSIESRTPGPFTR
jgi:Transposase, Mutator family